MEPVHFYSTSSDFTYKVKTVEKAIAGGKTIQVAQVIRFVNGRFVARTQEEVDALENCSAYKLRVFKEDKADRKVLAKLQEAFDKEEAPAPSHKGKRGPKPGRKSKADEMAALEAELAS